MQYPKHCQKLQSRYALHKINILILKFIQKLLLYLAKYFSLSVVARNYRRLSLP
jgi:hypothetical protein